MSFDRWIMKPVTVPVHEPNEPRINLGLDKDIPDLANKIFDRMLNYHTCAENQVNQLLQSFEYSKVFERSEKEFAEIEKNIDQSTNKIIQCTTVMNESNPEIQKSLTISLAHAHAWLDKRKKYISTPSSGTTDTNNTTASPSKSNQ